MKKYKKPSNSTKKCIEAGGTFTLSSRDYKPKRRGLREGNSGNIKRFKRRKKVATQFKLSKLKD